MNTTNKTPDPAVPVINQLSFDGLGIAPMILDILDKLKFKHPTPIQHQALPPAIEGKDLIGIAQTGTGKTLAFAIPMVQRLAATKGKGLVIVPTRELAAQVEETMHKLTPKFNMRTALLIGGASMHMQVQALRRLPRIILATPGRLLDHMEQRTINLGDVNCLVLDEADRMFDMGFEPQIRQVLKQIPKERQTMLFSATMPPKIMQLASTYLQLPAYVEIAKPGTTSDLVTQELYIVTKENKNGLLVKLLESSKGSVLIFSRTKIGAVKIARGLHHAGINVAQIHSDRTLGQRREALEGFKTGKYRVLVATDIASRGIDVTAIELVVNYDLPDDLDNYVHRIGRTGRAGHKGRAVTLAMPDQYMEVARIERLVQMQLAVVEHPDVPSAKFPDRSAPTGSRMNPRSRGGFGGGRGGFGGGRRGGFGGGRSFGPRRGGSGGGGRR